MNSITNFCNFLWSGSLYPELEQKFENPDANKKPWWMSSNEEEVTGQLITATFKRNDYTLKDFEQLQVVATKIGGFLPVTGESFFTTYTIHNQVVLKCFHIEWPKRNYEQIIKWAVKGSAITGVIAIASIIFASQLKSKPIFAINLCLITVLSISSCVGLVLRKKRAAFFLDKMQQLHESKINFPAYRDKIKSIREDLYEGGQVDSGNPLMRQAVSSSELEIIKLSRMCDLLKEEETNASVILEKILDIYSIETSWVAPELKEIQTYFEAVISSNWIATVSQNLIQEIKQGKCISKADCVKELSIISKVSVKRCLSALSWESKTKVVEHLKHYLAFCLGKKEGAALPTQGNMPPNLIKETKENVRTSMLSILKKHKILLTEIPVDSPFWKEAGLNSDFQWSI